MAKDSSSLSDRSTLLDEINNSELYGRNIYLLGSAEYGPTNEPILCTSTSAVANKFGVNGTLYDAFHKLKYTNKNNNVYLVKTTGQSSSNYLNVNIDDSDIVHQGFTIESIESNEIFNEIKIVITNTYIQIELPDYYNNEVFRYTYADYPMIYQLSDAINNDEDNKVRCYYSVEEDVSTAKAFAACNPSYLYLTGGLCGINYSKDMLYNCLDTTYSNLESMNIDLIVPIDAFIDDVYPDDSNSNLTDYGMKYFQSSKDYLTEDTEGNKYSFMNQLINFCIVQNQFGIVTQGVMGFNSKQNEYSDIYNESNDLAKMWVSCLQYNYGLCENPSYSFLISVVAGDVKYNNKYIDNGYLAYTALCSDTMVTEGTTNLAISDNILLYHELEQEYLDTLVDNGIVAFRYSVLKQCAVVYSGVTCYQSGNGEFSKEFANFANVRQIQLAINKLNAIFQYYIGYNISDVVTSNIIYSDIEKILNTLVTKNVLQAYEYSVVPNYTDGTIQIELVLQALYMSESIKITPVVYTQYSGSEVIV